MGGRAVADAGTITSTSEAARSSGAAEAPGRGVHRARNLPGGRAVVGALLVTAAAVATFAAYLSATAEPTTAYLVATDTVEPGTRFETMEQVTAAIGSATVELTSPLDERAIPVADLETLVGRVLVAPLNRGDLLMRTSLVDDGGVAPAQTLSFSLPRDAAVGGALRPGERLDVLATYGSSEAAYTAYVLRGVPLLRITAPDGGSVGSANDLVLTVAVTELGDVQALGHALNTAEVFVTRSTAGPGDEDAAPGPFRADPQAPGPVPDPATSISPGAGSAADRSSPSSDADADAADEGTDRSPDTSDLDTEDAG